MFMLLGNVSILRFQKLLISVSQELVTVACLLLSRWLTNVGGWLSLLSNPVNRTESFPTVLMKLPASPCSMHLTFQNSLFMSQ
jgi:hypothetical protein